MGVAGVKFRDDLAFEPFVERDGFGGVPARIIPVFLAIPQRPPDFRARRLRPTSHPARKN